jgi:hypothetical protein
VSKSAFGREQLILMRDETVASQEEDRRWAQRCLEMAQTCADPKTALLLRTLAAEFFDLANDPGDSVPISQQQIQPKTEDKH